MSRGAETTLKCWDGEYTFRLRIGELRQLQEKCDAGPMHITRRLVDGTWRVDDVRETLRLGLIGAGTAQQDALKLIERHVDTVPIGENIITAQSVVLASIYGAGDEVLGEVETGEATDQSHSPVESSGSPASTEPAS